MNTLILIPSSIERDLLPSPWRKKAILCGVGVIDAAINSFMAMKQNPLATRCLLVGLAGSYDIKACPLASIVQAKQIDIQGLGAGERDNFQSLDEMGLSSKKKLPAMQMITQSSISHRKIMQVNMLTVCAASGSIEHANSRLQQWPHAQVEDMEAYAVAKAAAQCHLPFACVRGVSNVAGDRDKKRWKIQAAMAAVGDVLSGLSQ